MKCLRRFINVLLDGQGPPGGKPVKPSIQPAGDGTYLVSYTPEEVGPYTVKVKYAGQEISNSPFKVYTAPTGDASKVKVPGQ